MTRDSPVEPRLPLKCFARLFSSALSTITNSPLSSLSLALSCSPRRLFPPSSPSFSVSASGAPMSEKSVLKPSGRSYGSIQGGLGLTTGGAKISDVLGSGGESSSSSSSSTDSDSLVPEGSVQVLSSPCSSTSLVFARFADSLISASKNRSRNSFAFRTYSLLCSLVFCLLSSPLV